MNHTESWVFITIVIAIFSVIVQLAIVNNKLDALIKAMREKRLFPTIPATGKPITQQEIEDKE